jgi:hypothetical protein
MRASNRLRAAAVFFLAVALIAGCGNDQSAEVSGTVTYDGKPIEDGAITFIPDNGPTAGGMIKDGKYTTKVVVGSSKVKISSSKVVGSKALYGMGSPERPVTAEALPAKYNSASELRYDVKTGSQTKDFDLAK